MALENFAFVLFKPKSPGNIGAAARALKNMGLRDLRIVAAAGRDERDATTMAVHGRDILASATCYPDLPAALADRTLVVGTTARSGPYRADARPIREVAPELSAAAATNRIAIVFGPEDFGLTSEELKQCPRLATILTAPEYPSLNLAQAVMIVAYELMLAAGASRELAPLPELASTPEVDAMLARIQRALVAIGFLPEENPDHLMFTIRAMLGRAGLKTRELDILNGIASQMLWFGEGGHETLAAKRRTGRKLR
ncbi:MAG TPA: RNA methyltransferase [Candidatus Binataceae bacterium]|nr:RNA methyltransferase [Candidatus Binataceae bacterium]